MADQIPARWLAGGEGHVTGVVGAETGRSCSSVTAANRGGRRSFEGGRRRSSG
jgi:hypothetical protein